MKLLRLILEITGGATYLAAHVPLAWTYVLGSSLQGVRPILYWAVIGLGYVVTLVLAFARPGRLGPVPPRRAFDAWLLTAAPALALCAVFVVYRWPLVFQGWDAHGLGAEGGEANAALFPWLHGLLWISLTTLRGGRRAGGQSEPNSRRP